MKSKQIFLVALVLTAAFVMSACDALPGVGGTSGNPTPTLPFPTNVVISTAVPGAETVAPGSTAAAPQEGVGIGGQIFNDSNGNGAMDGGEPVIAGVLVNLATGECPGTPSGQTTSTADTPSYQFAGLASGDYCVSIDAAQAQNAAVLGAGEWTVPQKTSGAISAAVKLRKQTKDNVDFGWTFSSLGGGTPVAPQPTAEAGQATAVPVLPTPTAFVQPTAPAGGGAPQGCVYRANFLQDVTVPDGTVMTPGTQFVKTWRVLNSGTCSWGPGSGLSNLAFVGGNQMGAPNLVPIPNAIPAGATADLSINMVAPPEVGTHKSNWKLRADDGTLIGVGPSNVALYALIRVRAAPPPTGVTPPTAVPPPPTAPSGGQAIQFAPGATEAEATGQLPANGIATYTVSAQAGQNMQLSLSSNSSSARVAVLTPTGVPIPPQRGNPEGTYWQGNLPATGNYVIQVLAGSAAPTANYSLNVTIPVRIVFAPGAISAQEQGTTSNGRIVTYLLKANGGQTMTVNLNAPPDSAGITIYGLDDGQPLIRSQSGATSFSGQLPATQDYVIQVVPFGNGQVNYTLDVTVQ
ncbi:MAG: hypothetical protein EYC68_14305 [Chloroflexota bacterium]|nr:MAG: hypothetical protein EYC68_14305 [Chloroflexota bacterium]